MELAGSEKNSVIQQILRSIHSDCFNTKLRIKNYAHSHMAAQRIVAQTIMFHPFIRTLTSASKFKFIVKQNTLLSKSIYY